VNTVVVLIGLLGAASVTQDADPVATITELEYRLASAWVKGDRPFVEALLTPDWTVTDPSGRVLTRQQVLDEAFVNSDRKIDAMAIDDVRVRVLGDTAVATGRTRATGTYRGATASVVLRFTDVFVRLNGRWQVVASHGTIVTP
jgi:ketosteroid isomerase-like protein